MAQGGPESGAHLEFRLLGPLEVWKDGRPLRLGGERQRALLALLLLHANEVVSSDGLIDELFDGQATETAANALQAGVSRLRRVLEEGDSSRLVVTRPPGYVLQVAPDQVDLARFERLLEEGRRALSADDPLGASAILREALGLWRGPLLADLGSQEFAERVRRRLGELRLAAVMERIDADLALGRHGELVGELEALVAEHPTEEHLRAQLMLALYRCGRQTDALDEYQRARRLLVEKFGVEPGPELREVQKAILNQDGSLAFAPVQQTEPVRVIEVVPEVGLPSLPHVPLEKRPRVTTARLAVAAIAGMVLVAVMVALAVIRSGGHGAIQGLEPNAIGEVDAKTAAIAAQLPLTGAPHAVTSGGGYVWVASSEGTVSRIDPELRTIQTLNVGGSAGGIAYGAGSLWVTNQEARSLVQINANTLKPVQTFPVGNGPGAVAVGRDAVWVANTIDGTLSRIGLDEGRVTRIPVGPSPVGIAVAPGAVWVTIEGNTVVRVDPTSRTIVQAVNVGNDPTGVSVGERGVWVANSLDGTVSHIDPATNSVTATTRTGAGPSAIAAGAGAIWVANGGDGTISRLDPRTGQPTKTLVLGNSPDALTLTNGKVFATTLSSPSGHRGGVLRVESSLLSSCRCVDPAFWAEEGNPTAVIVPPLVYDGLVAYRRVGGIAGAKLVPDLVTRLPAPTDEGRTYSFQLRSGLRYSDGTPVRAADFRYSLERLLTLGPDAGAYEGIVGAARCATRRSKHCDLSQGIQTDNRAGTITIHLTESDPEFLYKLAGTPASVVPAGTPLRPARTRPIPPIGPYRIASFDPDREIRLVRNKFFRVWSADARPEGYPDEIRFQLSNAQTAGVTAVEKRAADWVSLLSLAPERQRGVLTRYADRIRNDPAPITYWGFLNTRVPPFDDVRVRRAVNFADDRSALVEPAGLRGRPTCQILPPSFPGYRPYCPYTRGPNPAGTWTAPDLAKARALIAASRTAGMRVEVVAHRDEVNPLLVSRYFVSLLDELGYRASLHVLPTWPNYAAYVADSRNRAQIGVVGWAADTLAASNFFQPLFTCASFVPKSPANLNLWEYCDPRLDAKMKHAVALEVSDPEQANEVWATVDRAVVDQALALPFTNGLNPVLLSERVGNYQEHPLWGTLFDQLWVR